MNITSAESLPNETIVHHFGVVCGNTVRSKHFGRDIAAGLKTLIGGEVRGYTEMLAEARSEAIGRMREEAKKLGADAVVNVRFTTSMIMQGMAEMLAYGTAVKFAPKS